VKELFASVDLGGTKIAAAIAGSNGEILVEDRIATDSHEGHLAVLSRIAGLVTELSARLGAQPVTVGMGVPGLVDVHTRMDRKLDSCLATLIERRWRNTPIPS